MRKYTNLLFAVFLLTVLTSINLYAQDLSAVDYYKIGRDAESAGDFYKAVEMYKSALVLNDSYYDAVSGLAHAYYGLDEFDESLKYVFQAERLDPRNTDLMNLKGRIYLNTGELSSAKDVFSSVLEIEENNIEAEFGLAELDVASGQLVTAERRYENVLLVSPESRKALLSLVLINDDAGRMENAEVYLRKALQFYADNAFVRFIAARHYYRTENTEEALYHLQTALFLQPDFLDASILLCEIFMEEQNYKDVIVEIEKIIASYDDESILWYMLGRAYDNLGESERAIHSYARAIAIRPDEDLSRIALENEIITSMPMDSPLRARYSSYHIDLGQKNEARNMLDKALKEYRRALVIDPHSVKARLLYADIYKRNGYIQRYLLILSTLVEEGFGNTDILDELEIRKSMLDLTVAEKWNIDQFTVEKEQNQLSIFFSNKGMMHSEGGNIISEYIEYLLMGYENIIVNSNDMSDEFATCFRTARNNNSDYFIIFECMENYRAVSMQADIYLSSTGNKLTTLNLMRTGNQMLPEAGKAIAESIHNLLPVYGRIINRKFDEVVVNLGAKDGLKTGDELIILKKGSISRAKNEFILEYDDDAVIGTFKVNKADELVADGSIHVDKFFDMINPGDLIYAKPQAEDEELPAEKTDAQMFYTGNLFDSITNIP